MVLTDKFTFIHLPKTGGTFVQQVLVAVYDKNRNESLRFRLDLFFRRKFIKKIWIKDKMPNLNGSWGQHGGVCCIPDKQNGKAVLSVIRSPYNWYYSLYDFKWWEKYADLSKNVSFKKHKSFPNITFHEMMQTYQELVVEFGESLHIDLSEMGYYTWYFIMTYMNNPLEFLREENYSIQLIKKNIADKKIHFIGQENLNEELFDFLNSENYKNIQFVKEEGLVLPKGRGRGDVNFDAKEVLTDSELGNVDRLDKIIFEIFPKYSRLC